MRRAGKEELRAVEARVLKLLKDPSLTHAVIAQRTGASRNTIQRLANQVREEQAQAARPA